MKGILAASSLVLSMIALASLASASEGIRSTPTNPDQCEFIREELRKLPLAGGVIDIPAGTFECRNMIVIKKSNVRLRGAGQDRTTLRLGDYAHAPVLVIGDNKTVLNDRGEWVVETRVNNIEVSDLTVDGNLANQDPRKECGNGICDGDATSIRNNAITIRGASNITVKNVTSHSSISGGLVTEKYCDRLYVSNFTSYGNFFDGFAGYQTENSVFENVDLSGNRAAGISLDIHFNRNHFKGGVVGDNGDVGIFARDINDVIFDSLAITGNGNHGAFLAQAEYPNTCANRNEFRSVTVERSKGHGIHLASPCPGNKITGHSVLQNNLFGCLHVHPETVMDIGSSVVCR